MIQKVYCNYGSKNSLDANEFVNFSRSAGKFDCSFACLLRSASWTHHANVLKPVVPHDQMGRLGHFDCKINLVSVWSVTKQIYHFQGLVGAILCGFSKEDGVIPVNKNLYSLSFVLVNSSIDFIFLALLYFIVDVKHFWSGSPFYFTGQLPLRMLDWIIKMCYRNELLAGVHSTRFHEHHVTVAVAAAGQNPCRGPFHGCMGGCTVGHQRLLLVQEELLFHCLDSLCTQLPCFLTCKDSI